MDIQDFLAREQKARKQTSLAPEQQSKEQNKGGFGEGLGYVLGKAATGFLSIFEGAYDFIAGGIAKAVGNDDYAERLMEDDFTNRWSREIDEWYNPDKTMQFVGNVAGGIGNSASGMLAVGAAAALTAASGGTLAPLAGSLIAGTTMGVGAAGLSTAEAYNSQEVGADGDKKLTDKMFLYGGIEGALEGGMEAVSAGIGAGGGYAIKHIAKSFGHDVAQTAGKHALSKALISGFAGEAFEEGVQEMLEGSIQRITIDPNAKNSTPQEVLYAALVGGTAGLIMGGGDVATRSAYNTAKGKRIEASPARKEGVLNNAKLIAEDEAKNATGYDTYAEVSKIYNEYNKLVESGKGGTLKAQKLLGELETDVMAATFTEPIATSAYNIVQNAEAIAAKVNEMHIKDASGKELNVTAADIRKGYTGEKGSFSKSLKKNNLLRNLAVMDAMGHLVMDTQTYKENVLKGRMIGSHADLINFKETATDEEKKAVGEALGISDWNKVDQEEFAVKFGEYTAAGKYEEIQKTNKNIRDLKAKEAEPVPEKISLKDGESARYEIDGQDVGLMRNGDKYRVVDMTTGSTTIELSAEEAKKMLNKISKISKNKNEEIAKGKKRRASESQNMKTEVESKETIETTLNSAVKGYNKVKAGDKAVLRDIYRQAKAYGYSEEDAIMLVRFSKASGINLVFKDKLQRDSNAYYSISTNEIYLSKASTNQLTARQAVAHELTHAIYHFLGEDVRRAFEGRVTQDIKDRVDKTYKDFDQDVRNEEYIAHYIERALGDNGVMEEIIKEKPSLKEHIMNKLKGMKDNYAPDRRLNGETIKLINKYKKLFDKVAAKNANAQFADDKLKRIQAGNLATFVRGLLGAQAEAMYNDEGELLVAKSKDGSKVMYSFTTWDNGGKDALVRALKDNDFTDGDIKETVAEINAIRTFLEGEMAKHEDGIVYKKLADKMVSDIIYNIENGRQVFSTIYSNGDYPVNLDIMSNCKKRIAYASLLDALARDGVLDLITYTPDAIVSINEQLSSEGFETACIPCFVETRRVDIQAWAETLVEEWNSNVEKYDKNAGYFGFAKDGFSPTEAEIAELKKEFNDESLEKNKDTGNLKLVEGTAEERMADLLSKMPALRKKLTTSDLIITDSLKKIKQYDGTLYSIINSRYGAKQFKLSQDYNPYNGELADLTFDKVKYFAKAVKGTQKYRLYAKKELQKQGIVEPVEKSFKDKDEYNKRNEEYQRLLERNAMRKYLYDVGGVRIQSFSDFMITNVFDYMQILGDLAANRFPIHGYTKEAVCLRLLGLTGAKWNGSWIAHIDKKAGKGYAGLTDMSKLSQAERADCLRLGVMDGKEWGLSVDDYTRYTKTKGTAEPAPLQSIGLRDMLAVQLDPRYAGNVGSIIIGVSNKQIELMLESDYVRMIIPYHKSGMPNIFALLSGANTYTDYSYAQTTKVEKIEKKVIDENGKAKWVEVKKPQIYYETKEGKVNKKEWHPDTSFDFNEAFQRLGDARAAADEYLAWCRKHHTYKDIKGNSYRATFKPMFSGKDVKITKGPDKGKYVREGDFTKSRNYYKVLEDFTSYNALSNDTALQGPVKLRFPQKNELTPEQIQKYREDLAATGVFTKEQIDRCVEKANMSFEEIVSAELEQREKYAQEKTAQYKDTVQTIEKNLLENFAKDGIDIERAKKMIGSNSVNTGKVYSLKDSEGNTLTPEQVDYFKNSKVRDAYGRLLVVYHGTDRQFNEFKFGDIGYHFGTKAVARRRIGYGKNTILKKVYLNITNPIVINDDLGSWDADYQLAELLKNMGVISNDEYLSTLIGEYSNGDKYKIGTEVSNKRLRKILLDKGYDGIAYTNMYESKKTTQSYIAFNSNQIKEVTNNTPTESNDVRFSIKGDSTGGALMPEQISSAIGFDNMSEEEKSEVLQVTDDGIRFSLRTDPAPKKTIKAYKLFYVGNDGKLYPPMVANKGGAPTELGVWLDADEGKMAPPSKTGRPQVVAGGKGTKGGSGSLAYRPGWHAGEVSLARQFNVYATKEERLEATRLGKLQKPLKDKLERLVKREERSNIDLSKEIEEVEKQIDKLENKKPIKTVLQERMVWAEVEMAADINYQEDAMKEGITKNGKFQHSLAGLKRLPKDGYYLYRTNPDPTTKAWIISGAMKIVRLLSDREVNRSLRDAGLEAPVRKSGLKEIEDLGLVQVPGAEDAGYSITKEDSDGVKLSKSDYNKFKESKATDIYGDLLALYKNKNNGKINNISKYGNDVWTASNMGYAGSNDTQKVYLNITNPFVFQDINEGITTKDITAFAAKLNVRRAEFKKNTIEFSKMLDMVNSQYVRDLIVENGYDGIITQDGDVNLCCVFNSNQTKTVGDQSSAGLVDQDIRFSLPDGTEIEGEARNSLVAVHNVSEENAIKLFKLGGLPAPSIAILKNTFKHEAYGDISFVFDKSTIDPEADKNNKVYTYDGYTPMVPLVEYELGSDEFKKDIKENPRLKKYFDDNFKINGKYKAGDRTRDYLLINSGRNYAVVEQYAKEHNIDIPDIEDMGRVPKGLERVLKSMGTSMSEIAGASDEKVKELSLNGRDEFEGIARVVEATGGDFTDAMAISYGKKIRDYVQSLYTRNGNKIVDDLINAGVIDENSVKQWFEEKLNKYASGKGFVKYDYHDERNNAEDFSDTHTSYTASGALDAMHNQQENEPSLSAHSLSAVLSGKIQSIEEMREKIGVLYNDNTEREQDSNTGDTLHQEIMELAGMIGKVGGVAVRAVDVIFGVAKDKALTLKAVKDGLKRYGINDNNIAKKMLHLFKELVNVKTPYFEAKPMRVVSYSEILKALIPESSSKELANALEKVGVPYEKYNSNRTRQDIINEMDNVRFSLKEDSEGGTLTAEQQNYFKDSMIRDPFGRLLVMYHGSENYGFTKFDKNYTETSQAFYFSNSDEVAETYTSKYDAEQTSDKVYGVYLNVKNPLIIDGEGNSWNQIPNRLNIYSDFVNKVIDDFHKLVAEENLVDESEFVYYADAIESVENAEESEPKLYELRKRVEKAYAADKAEYESHNFPGTTPMQMWMWDHFMRSTDQLVEYARDNGYDGVVFNNLKDTNTWVEDPISEVVAVFDSNQIKSIDNMSPTSDDDIRFSLAGEGSATADTKALEQAKSMREAGADNTETRKKTGWFLGGDGKWRYEISNADVKLKDFYYGPLAAAAWDKYDVRGAEKYIRRAYNELELEKDIENVTSHSYKLKDVIDAPSLFKAYPALKKYTLTLTDDPNTNYLGVYSKAAEQITIDKQFIGKEPFMSVLFHEIQHVIQDIEGFAEGGSEDTRNSAKSRLAQVRRYLNVIKAHKKAFKELSQAKQDELKQLYNRTRPHTAFRIQVVSGAVKAVYNYPETIYQHGTLTDDESLIEAVLDSSIEKKLKQEKDSLNRWVKAYPDAKLFYAVLYGEQESRNVGERVFYNEDQLKAFNPYDGTNSSIGVNDAVTTYSRNRFGDPDIRFSLNKDSEGKTLTPGQQEYFKYNDAVDEDGRLLVLYHGSDNYGFNTFDTDMSDDNKSIFLTTSKDVAKSYTKDSKKLYKVYAKVEDPFTVYAGGREWDNLDVEELDSYSQQIDKNGRIKSAFDKFITEWNSGAEDDYNLMDVDKIIFEYSDGSTLTNLFENMVKEDHGGYKFSDILYFPPKKYERVSKMVRRLDGYYEEYFKTHKIPLGYLKGKYTTRDVAEYAYNTEHDGAIFYDIIDNGSYAERNDARYFDNESTIVAVYDSNQIKLTSNLNPTEDQDIRFSLKEGNRPSWGQVAKTNANNSRMKVYSKGESEARIDDITKTILNSDDMSYIVDIKNKDKEEIAAMLWKNLNSVDEGYRTEAAEKIADALITRATVEDYWNEREFEVEQASSIVSAIRPYMHNVNLQGMKDEVASKYGNKNAINLVWGARKNAKGLSMDGDIVPELASNGVMIDSEQAPQDQFFEMVDLYDKAKAVLKEKIEPTKLTEEESEEELKKIKGEIVRNILNAYDEMGTESKYSKKVGKYMSRIEYLNGTISNMASEYRLKNDIIYRARKLKEYRKGEYINAGFMSEPTLDAFAKELGSVEHVGVLRKNGKKVRESVAQLDGFFTPEVLDTDDQQYFDQGIKDDIRMFVENLNRPDGELTNLTIEELEALDRIMKYIEYLYKDYDTVFWEGKRQSTQKVAGEYVQQAKRTPVLSKIGNVFRKMLNPFARFLGMQGYENKGAFMSFYHALQKGHSKKAVYMETANSFFEEFTKKHPKYADSLREEWKYGLTKGDAITLWLTYEREQGRNYLDIDGAKIQVADAKLSKKGNKKKAVQESKTIEFKKEMLMDLTETDKEFIQCLRSYFAWSGQMISQTEMERFGFANAKEENYFPISVSGDEIFDLLGESRKDSFSLARPSFTYKLRAVGKGKKLFIGNVLDIVYSQINQASTYYGYSNEINNIAKIWNANTKDGKLKEESRRIDSQFADWFQTYLRDIQGINGPMSSTNLFLGKARGFAAKGALGANPKVWFNQLTSIPMAKSVGVSYRNQAVGFVKVMNRSKFRASYEEMIKHAPETWLRYQGSIAVKDALGMQTQSKLDKATDWLTGPIQFFDKVAITGLWEACKRQCNYDMNKTVALFEDTLRLTQPNYEAINKSELLRSKNELVKMATMYMTQPIQNFSMLFMAFDKLDVARRTHNAAMLKEVRKEIASTLSAFIMQQTMFVMVAQLFKWLLDKDRKDKNGNEISVGADIAKDFGGAIFGMFPLVRDMYSYFVDGYEPSNVAYSAWTNLLKSVTTVGKTAEKLFSEEAVSTKEILGNFRYVLMNFTQAFGIPIRNIERYTIGLIKRFDPATAYEYDTLFYNKRFTQDIEKALSEGDYKLADAIMNSMFDEDKAGSPSAESREVILDLYSKYLQDRQNAKEFNIMPKTIGTSITYKDEKIKLTKDQRKRFIKTYGLAAKQVDKLIASERFGRMSESAQARAIKLIYDGYYSKAKSDLIAETMGYDPDITSKFYVLSKALNPDRAAMMVAQIGQLKQKVNKAGRPIGPTRKEQIERYLRAQHMNPTQRMFLMYMLGYSLPRPQLLRLSRYVKGLDLSDAEKQTLIAKLLEDSRKAKNSH